MLEHLGQSETANRVRSALGSVIAERKSVTRDLGGRASTTEFAEAVVRRLEAGVEAV
jgi:isocitrate dehydrogenase (NAD+)